jgi:hypothetical protein
VKRSLGLRAPYLVLGVVLATLIAGGCAIFPDLDAALVPPRVRFHGATVVEAPSLRQIQAALCPQALRAQMEGPMPGASVAALCESAFGPVPPSAALDVIVDLQLVVENRNTLSLPVTEILTAVTVFPDTPAERIGTACLVLCPPEDPACRGRALDQSCAEAREDVRTLGDYPEAIPDLTVLLGIKGAPGERIHRERAWVPGRDGLAFTARLAFVPEALVPILAQVARGSAKALAAGQSLGLNIPYRLEGTVFMHAGNAGRSATGFGPVRGTWPIPLDPLVLAGPPDSQSQVAAK